MSPSLALPAPTIVQVCQELSVSRTGLLGPSMPCGSYARPRIDIRCRPPTAPVSAATSQPPHRPQLIQVSRTGATKRQGFMARSCGHVGARRCPAAVSRRPMQAQKNNEIHKVPSRQPVTRQHSGITLHSTICTIPIKPWLGGHCSPLQRRSPTSPVVIPPVCTPRTWVDPALLALGRRSRP